MTVDLLKLNFPLLTDGIIIRLWEEADFSCVLSASKDPYIPEVTSIPLNSSIEGAKDWIHRQNQKIKLGSDLPLCIARSIDNKAMGMIGVFGLLESNVKARCGYWIDPEQRGQGFSNTALTKITEWVFDNLPVTSLELFIEPENKASIKIAVNSGYSFSGHIVDDRVLNGKENRMHLYTCFTSREEN